MYDDFSKLPGFAAVKQDGLHVGIEDPYLGGINCYRRINDDMDEILHKPL